MKNKILVISAFLLTVLVSGGCDMFRSLAGRPTSADIEAMRVELAAREAAEAARRDSLERAAREAEAEAARIAAALDSLGSMKGFLRTPARLGGLAKGSEPSSKYCIVIGSYLDRANALKYSEKLTAEGFPSEAVSFRNGFTTVGVCPTDNPADLLASLRRVRQQKFCPKEVWILLNE
jgi:hypothetical protein